MTSTNPEPSPAPWQGKLVVESLLGRRKAKRDFEYEVKWWGMPSDPKHNKWIMKAECAPASPPDTFCKWRVYHEGQPKRACPTCL